MSTKYDLLLLDKPHDLVIGYYNQVFNVINWDNRSRAEVIYTHLTKIKWCDYPRLKYVLCPVTSCNHLNPIKGVDIFYLEDKAWLYRHVWSTAEWTVAAMLRLVRETQEELTGGCVGFIGYGRVAQQVAHLLQNFNCEFLYFDKNNTVYNNVVATRASRNDIYKYADIITVHLSENDKTIGMVDREAFNSILAREVPPIFINSSRSSIVDANSLIRSLVDGAINGCALDVIDSYSYAQKKILYQLSGDKLIITPHIAGQSSNSRQLTDTYIVNQFFSRIDVLH
jgi:phosphoglycerate dehydrogenase-like enzyme